MTYNFNLYITICKTNHHLIKVYIILNQISQYFCIWVGYLRVIQNTNLH